MAKRKKGKTGPPWSEAAKLIATLFKRRLSTHWDCQEIAQFQLLQEMKRFETLYDLHMVIRYYDYERKKPADKGIHRRHLITFLNNYGGECDKAHDWAARFPKLAYPNSVPPPTPTEPAKWREFLADVYPRANQDALFRNSPTDVQREFREWEKKQ